MRYATSTVTCAIGAATGLALACLAIPGPAAAQPVGEILDRNEMRVCADPNDLPFSNEKGEGFENKIAQILGKELNLPVRYVFFPQVTGFVRNTLLARSCDLIMGTVTGDDLVQTTTPYYYSGYVAVYRADRGLAFASLDDPKLKSLHIGIISATPPSNLLVRHDLMANARPYALLVDTRYESTTHQMVDDIMKGEIDMGLLWGPIAGYFIKSAKLPLAISLVPNEPGEPRMEYHIAIGVRANEREWRRRINNALQKEHQQITAVLEDYGIPLLDEQGRLLPPSEH
jgi:quinoprotein dehydrogenase-associated probable ABC transporter substrate-binding protein